MQGTSEFLNAIRLGDRDRFFESLSRRTARLMASDTSITPNRIWAAARNILGSVENQRIVVVGGSRDSVTLRIDGSRTVDGTVTTEPVLLDMLREGGRWKVSYPGLRYPLAHLRK